MYKYSVKIRKVTGRLNESVLPNKNLIVKSKNRITKQKAFVMAEKYLKNKYGLSLLEANIVCEGFFGNLFGKKKQAQAQPQQQVELPQFPNSQIYNYKGDGHGISPQQNRMFDERGKQYCKLRNKEFGGQRFSSRYFSLGGTITEFLSASKKYFTNITNLISSQQVDVATKEILSKKYDGEVDKVFQEIRKEGNNLAHAIDSGYEKIKNKGKQVIGDSLQILEHVPELQKFRQYQNKLITALTQKGFGQDVIGIIKDKAETTIYVLDLYQKIQDVVYKFGENDRYGLKLMYAFDNWNREYMRGY